MNYIYSKQEGRLLSMPLMGKPIPDDSVHDHWQNSHNRDKALYQEWLSNQPLADAKDFEDGKVYKELEDFECYKWCSNQEMLHGIPMQVSGKMEARLFKKTCPSCYLVAIKKKDETADEFYPGKYYQQLFNLMSKEHDILLLESEMKDIIEVVKSMKEDETKRGIISQANSPDLDSLASHSCTVGNSIEELGRYIISAVRWATGKGYFYECGAWYGEDEKICDTDEEFLKMVTIYLFILNVKSTKI